MSARSAPKSPAGADCTRTDRCRRRPAMARALRCEMPTAQGLAASAEAGRRHGRSSLRTARSRLRKDLPRDPAPRGQFIARCDSTSREAHSGGSRSTPAPLEGTPFRVPSLARTESSSAARWRERRRRRMVREPGGLRTHPPLRNLVQTCQCLVDDGRRSDEPPTRSRQAGLRRREPSWSSPAARQRRRRL